MDILPFALVMLGLLGFSAFFSGSETALFSLTVTQTRQISSSHPRVGHVIERLLKEPENLLITLLVGNMTVNVVYFTSASVATLLMRSEHTAPGWAISAWAVGALIVLVLVGEVSPKVLAFSYPAWISRLVAPPLYVLHQAIRPIHRLLHSALVRPLTRLARPADHPGRALTIVELRELLEVSERRGVLHADETMMLREVLGFGQVKVRDVMIPRVELVAFDAGRPLAELQGLLRSSGRSRVPVYRGNMDNILGWVEARSVFLEPDRAIADLLEPVHYTVELATVEQLLHDLRRNRQDAAIVVDEYGGTAGLVTLQDVLGQIVGDIPAAGQPQQPLVRQIGPAEYSVAGQLPIHDWAELFGGELDDPRLVTVGGLVTKLLGRLPRPGDRARYGNVTFTVESMGRRRIERLRLTLQPEQEAVP